MEENKTDLPHEHLTENIFTESPEVIPLKFSSYNNGQVNESQTNK